MTHHHHHHHHDSEQALSFDEKMVKLLEHWIKHNDDHAASYKDWAKKAKDNGLGGVDSLLLDAAEMTAAMSKKFEEAISKLKDV